MKKLILALCLLALLVAGSAAAAEPDEEYVISPRDHIKISVMFHEDLSGTYVPLSDYSFEYPLLGTVYAPGKTIKQFTAEMKERLSEYIIDPKLTINISSMGGTKVYVFGIVPKQGAFYLNERTHNVVDALAAAGGFGRKTAKKSIYLIRKGNERNIQKLNINQFLTNGDVSQNPILYEGDCLYLTSNHKLDLGTILGLVTRAIAAWNDIDDIGHHHNN